MEKEYRTYKYYNRDGRRLSIFAEEKDGFLHIVTLRCDKANTFSKRVAVGLYKFWKEVGKNNPVVKPLIDKIPVVDGKGKSTFIAWCNDTYFKIKEERFDFKAPIEEAKLVKQSKLSQDYDSIIVKYLV